jgi:hypothetical protein
MHLRRMGPLDETTQQQFQGEVSFSFLQFIFELQEQGLAVSVSMVMRNAKQILPQYALKSRVAQYHSALRFVRSQGHL